MHGSAANAHNDIVDTARSESSFRLFLNALQSVPPMVDYLKGAGPFTVFMPTDQAVNALPANTFLELEKPENSKKLEKLLKAHVVLGRHSSANVKTMQSLAAESGDQLMVESNGRGIKVNNAMVLGGEILCTNGIIHAIDAVLQTA